MVNVRANFLFVISMVNSRAAPGLETARAIRNRGSNYPSATGC